MLIRNILIACAWVLMAVASFSQYSPPKEIKLEVLKVRVLDPIEMEKVRGKSELLGYNIAIRMRLTTGNRSIYYLSPRGQILPCAYQIILKEMVPIWANGNEKGGKSTSSPGIERFMSLLQCEWLLMPNSTAIEWEMFDSTGPSGEKHAFSIFIKEYKDSEPREIISELYTIPPGPYPIPVHGMP